MFTGQTRDQAPGLASSSNLELLGDLVRRKRLKARLPLVQDVSHALLAFLKHEIVLKDDRLPTLLDTQAVLLLEGFRYVAAYVKATPRSEDQDLQLLDQITDEQTRALERLCKILSMRHLKGTSNAHLELVKFVRSLPMDASAAIARSASSAHINILCLLDRPQEALDILNSAQQLEAQTTSSDNASSVSAEQGPRLQKLYERLASAFARAGQEENMLAMLANIDKAESVEMWSATHKQIMTFYITRKDSTKIKLYAQRWLEELGALSNLPKDADSVLRTVLTYAAQSDKELGNTIVTEITRLTSLRPLLNEVLAYSFAASRSVDEVFSQMKQYRTKGKPVNFNIDTLNRLIEVAVEAQDPYLAERLIATGRERKWKPDARTFMLQLKYRLTVKDIDGALLAYKNLQQQLATSDDEDVPLVNKLIVALCESGRHDFETIMNVAADLSDRRVAFEAETVRVLALVHLKRDEVQDVEDLIKTHARAFNREQRKVVRDTLVEYAVLPDTRLNTLWDTYQILRNEFDEMGREPRTQIMTACFAKGRTDLAVHVFVHMRSHSRTDTYPNADTYVAAFMGAASAADTTSLDAIHNQLRLDTNVDITTKMRNALMIAMITTGVPKSALLIWEDIIDSYEGPTYSSISIALRACQVVPRGHLTAEEIWKRLRRNDVDLNQSIWAAYLAAIASNDSATRAIELVRSAVAKNEVRVDALIIGSLANVAAGPEDAQMIEDWAQEEHPETWKELEQMENTDLAGPGSWLKNGLDP